MDAPPKPKPDSQPSAAARMEEALDLFQSRGRATCAACREAVFQSEPTRRVGTLVYHGDCAPPDRA